MKRRYDLDWIRVTVVLSIILYHVCDMFILNRNIIIFARADTELNFCLYIQMFFARWHMVILFLISGMAVFYSLTTKSIGSFIKTRFTKILIPMLLGCVLLNPITSYLHGLSIGRTQSFLEQVQLFFTSVSENMEAMTTGFGPMHLWFLLDLFVFTMVCMPFFLMWNEKIGDRYYNKIIAFITKPMMLLILCAPYPFLYWAFPMLGERSPIGYLYVFILGYLFATDSRIQEALDRDKYLYTILSIALLTLFYYWELNGHLDTINAVYDLRGYAVKIVKLLICFSILGICHCYIPQKRSAVLTTLNNISFELYIVHMPIMILIAYEIFKSKLNPHMQFILIVSLSYIVTIFICLVYNRGKYRLQEMIEGECNNDRRAVL